MGGEPLYHKRFRDLIAFLCDNKHTDFHLTFVTNGTIYDPGLMKQLENFKSVQIEISIENFDISNDYIRHPSKTDTIVNNIKKYLAHTDEKCSTVLRTVPQLLSLMHYDKFLDFCLENSVIVDSNVLHRPEFFRPCYLPDTAKQLIKSRLSRFILNDKSVLQDINLRNQSRVTQSISHHASMIIGLLDQESQDKNTVRQDLTDYCARLDKVREHDLREFVPELAEFLDEYGYAKKRY
jgi:molybdenum cofactor biosynthesis enzyme MoaA